MDAVLTTLRRLVGSEEQLPYLPNRPATSLRLSAPSVVGLDEGARERVNDIHSGFVVPVQLNIMITMIIGNDQYSCYLFL